MLDKTQKKLMLGRILLKNIVLIKICGSKVVALSKGMENLPLTCSVPDPHVFRTQAQIKDLAREKNPAFSKKKNALETNNETMRSSGAILILLHPVAI